MGSKTVLGHFRACFQKSQFKRISGLVVIPALLTWVYFPGLAGPYSTGKLIVTAILGMWLAFGVTQTRRTDLLGALYLATLVVSTLVSVDLDLSVFGLQLTYCVGLLAAFVLVPFWTCSTNQDFRSLQIGLRIAGVGLALVGLAQKFGVEFVTPFPLPFGERAYSTMGSPVYAGQIAAMLLPFAVGKIELGLLCAFLWATGSRGAWLAAAVGFFYLRWPQFSPRVRFYVVSGCLSAFLLALCLRPPSDLGRACLWSAAVEAFAMRPWVGWGTGSFLIVADIWRDSAWVEAFGRSTQDHAHNAWLEALSSGGIIGFFGLVVLWYATSRTQNRIGRASLIAVAISSLVNPLPLPVKALAIMISAMGQESQPASKFISGVVKCFSLACLLAVTWLVHLDRMVIGYTRYAWSISSGQAAFKTNMIRVLRQRREFKF